MFLDCFVQTLLKKNLCRGRLDLPFGKGIVNTLYTNFLSYFSAEKSTNTAATPTTTEHAGKRHDTVNLNIELTFSKSNLYFVIFKRRIFEISGANIFNIGGFFTGSLFSEI